MHASGGQTGMDGPGKILNHAADVSVLVATGARRWDDSKVYMKSPTRFATDWRKLARRFDVGTFEQQVRYGVLSRPAYGYCLWQAADLARRLQYPSISVIEFGVAGGNGLLVLEDYAASVSAATGVNIDVYGFDTGEGLPTPTDYRDMPYRWKGGDFKMETSALEEARLSRARLVIGDVKDTVPRFFEETNRSPRLVFCN